MATQSSIAIPLIEYIPNKVNISWKVCLRGDNRGIEFIPEKKSAPPPGRPQVDVERSLEMRQGIVMDE